MNTTPLYMDPLEATQHSTSIAINHNMCISGKTYTCTGVQYCGFLSFNLFYNSTLTSMPCTYQCPHKKLCLFCNTNDMIMILIALSEDLFLSNYIFSSNVNKNYVCTCIWFNANLKNKSSFWFHSHSMCRVTEDANCQCFTCTCIYMYKIMYIPNDLGWQLCWARFLLQSLGKIVYYLPPAPTTIQVTSSSKHSLNNDAMIDFNTGLITCLLLNVLAFKGENQYWSNAYKIELQTLCCFLSLLLKTPQASFCFFLWHTVSAFQLVQGTGHISVEYSL